jgi:uncharacterized protein (DUF1684 family)
MKLTCLLILVLFLPISPLLAQNTATAPSLSVIDHAREVAAFQQAQNAKYRDPARSPLPPAMRQEFRKLPFFPTNYAARVEGRFVPDSVQPVFAMQTSTSRQPMYRKYGKVHFVLAGQALTLTLYQAVNPAQEGDSPNYLFLPFTDRTNGHGSYGGGRYIDVPIPTGTAMWVDFNLSYNPYCAYSPQYSCPVPPAENRLPVAIKAGVMSDH